MCIQRSFLSWFFHMFESVWLFSCDMETMFPACKAVLEPVDTVPMQ